MLVSISSSFPFQRLIGFFESWQRLLRTAGHPYRPELHYMRGPGPACRAKQRGHHPI